MGFKSESDVYSLSKTLHPISDQEWEQLAGARSTETYDIVRGDTLFDISKRLFGDGKYWPKIWALNNGRITNPHWIRPGYTVAFRPGDVDSLPSVSMTDAASGMVVAQASTGDGSSHAPFPKGMSQSKEWQDLPRQPWERVSVQLPPDVDPHGFDRKNRIQLKKSTGFDLNGWVSDALIPAVGGIQSSSVEARYFQIQDRVLVQPAEGQSFVVGAEYTMISEPTDVSSPDGRSTHSYRNLGTIQVLENKGAHAVGLVTSITDMVPRGTMLIAKIPRAKEQAPVAGSQAVRATVIVDRTQGSSFATAQHKTVFVDRGSRDGVGEGMIFRVYFQKDPDTDEALEVQESTRLGHLQVIQVSETFSTAVVYNSRTAIDDEAPAVLLTDVSDLELEPRAGEPTVVPETSQPSEPGDLPSLPVEAPPSDAVPPPAPADDLDGLDDQKDLDENEKKELQQLEEWKKDPSQNPPPADIPPSDGVAPPPQEIPTDLPPEIPTEVLPEDPTGLPPVGPETAPPPPPPEEIPAF